MIVDEKKLKHAVQSVMSKSEEIQLPEGVKLDHSKIEFDLLQLYFREPYEVKSEIGNGFKILQPSIGDIIAIGERKFYQTLQVFITNTTAKRLALWMSKPRIDWNVISDYDLFLMSAGLIDAEIAKLLFDGIDFSKMKMLLGKNNKPAALINQEKKIIITENVYNIISQYLRTMFNIFPKVEKTLSEYAKESIIEEELINEYYNKKKTTQSSVLFPLISACVNHPGFKYKSNELKEVGIFEFMDSVQRLQIYESSTALMKGMYSGFVDSRKINAESYNFMRAV
ncbi:MAG: hypothetical protein Q4G33_14585 [bacterium]|nr:hypothetical protein [bacterium]